MNGYVATKIMEVLSMHCRGRENAHPRTWIDERLRHFGIDITDRNFRAHYSGLAKCSCEDGLFIPIRPEEVTEYERYSLLTRPPAEVALKVRRIHATWPALKTRPKIVQVPLFPQPEVWR